MNSDAGDHVRAAADNLNDACTELSRARTATSSDDVREIVAKHEELAKDLETTLHEVAVSAYVAEVEATR